MLAVLRMPVLDFRPFAAYEELYPGIRLPGTWSDGEFVRGVGAIQRRPARSVSDWPSERTYADFRNAVRFPTRSIEHMNNRLQAVRVQSIYRRLWHALPEVDCLFDYDFSVSFGYRKRDASFYPQLPRGSLYGLLEAPVLLSALPIMVGSQGRGPKSPLRSSLLRSGHILAEHFGRSTAMPMVRNLGRSFVKAGRPVLTVEAPGLTPVLDMNRRTDRYQIDDLKLFSCLLPIKHGRPLRCYWITSDDASPAARRRVRELRIHVLRLHSIDQFLTGLTSTVQQSTRSRTTFAVTPSAAYDRLQLAIVSVLRTLRSVRVAGIGPTPNLLSAAFLAHEFIEDYALQVLERRLLAAARPAVLRGLRSLVDDEADRRLTDGVLDSLRDRAGVLTILEGGLHMSKYDLRGANVGAVGDNASASDFVQGQNLNVIRVEGQEFDRFQLATELSKLHAAITQGNVPGSEGSVDKNQMALKEAETAARAGNGEGVKASLSKLSRWVLRLAQATGSAVAAAAIAHTLGL